MAQVTLSLVDEQRARHARGEHFNLTINEEEQLLFSWIDQRRYQQIAWLRINSRNEYLVQQIMIKYGFGERDDDVWVFNQDKAEQQGFPIIDKIFKEARNALGLDVPQPSTQESSEDDAGNSSGA